MGTVNDQSEHEQISGPMLQSIQIRRNPIRSMSTYRPSAFDTTELTPDRSGAPDSGPRTPWSPVRAIRGRVARPFVDLEEPDE